MDFLAPIKRNNTDNIFKYTQDPNIPIYDRAMKFFNPIMGYDQHKENIYRTLLLPKNVNILLHGAASNGKTMFLNVIEDQCYDVVFYDATASTSAGLIEKLYEVRNSIKVLEIDEISELKKNDIDALRGLMNNGRVTKTLKTKRYDFRIPNLKIIATCNNISKLSPPIRSRFQEYKMNEYDNETFKKVFIFCLKRDCIIRNEILANKIADYMLYNNIRTIRKAVSLCRLINEDVDTEEDIQRVIDNQIQNSADYDNTNYNVS